MSDNTFVAIIIICAAFMLHSCTTCEKERQELEFEKEKYRTEHAQKEKS